MALTLIEKYPGCKDKPVKIITRQTLSDREKALLAGFFVLDELLEWQDKKSIHTLCLSIRERDLWIACDCLDSAIQPVFRINRAVSGNLYLHRITSRKNHAPSCLFKENGNPSVERKSSQRAPMLYSEKPFNLLGKESQDLIRQNSGADRGDSEQKARVPTLGKVLYTLLEKARLNTVSGSPTLPPWQALRDAASHLMLTDSLPLVDHLELNPAKIAYRSLLLKKDLNWGKKQQKHCLCLLHVKSFTAKSLEVIYADKTTKPLEIATRIYVSSGRFSERTGPYMALVLISTTAEEPWFYRPVNAYVLPAYSHTSFLPMDSFYEREFMRCLFRLYYAAQKKGRPFQVIKPLFDIAVLANEEKPSLVLPDFLIRRGGQTLVVEVNGSNEPAYLERKERTQALMKHLGDFLCLDAWLAESKQQLSEELTRFMRTIEQWLGGV